MVVLTHESVGPQPVVAHEVPATGGAAHVPQSASLATEQKPELHWALKAHAAPVAPVPFCARHSVGGMTPDRYASQVVASTADEQASVVLGVAAVALAPRLCVQASFSRVSQVEKSPQRRARSVAEQVDSFEHRLAATSLHACSAV